MRHRIIGPITLLSTLTVIACGKPSEPVPRALPPGAVALFDGGAAPRWTTGAGAGEVVVAPAPDQPFDSAYTLFVPAATDPVWDAALGSVPIPVAVDSGAVLHGWFYVRADFDGLQNESNTGSYEAYLQATDQEWVGLANFSGRPGPAWRRVYFTGRATRDYPAGAINVSLHLGTQAQRVSAGGLQVYRLPPETDLAALPVNVLTYEGRAADAPWRAEAERRIDEHRRGTLTVRVLDGAGGPRAGVPVDVELAEADFRLGTLARGPAEFDDAADYRRWRDTTARYFDALTCKMYPADDWGWQNPDQRRRNIATLDWAIAEGYPVRAHVLVWPGWRWSPAAWRALADAGRGDELRARVNAHVREVMDTLSSRRVDVVDVFNEPRVNYDVDDAVGAPSPRPGWFQIAREVAPDIRLAINEFGVVSGFGTNEANIDGYIEDIRDILAAGGEIDVIGVQGHMGEGFTAPARLWEVLDRLAVFGKPIHVTEFDVATDDDAVQADYTCDFLTAALAHPSVEQVTLWGYYAPLHWRPAGALWDADWRRLPAGDALVAWRDRFWRKPAGRVTGMLGEVSARLMVGNYRLSVGDQGVREVTVTSGAEQLVVVSIY